MLILLGVFLRDNREKGLPCKGMLMKTVILKSRQGRQHGGIDRFSCHNQALGYKWQKTQLRQGFQKKDSVGSRYCKNPSPGMGRTRGHMITSFIMDM